MLIVLERKCQELCQVIEQMSERYELRAALVESKTSLEKDAPEKFQEKIFRELKELEGQKSKEASELLGRKHKLEKLERERDRAGYYWRGSRQGQKVILLLPQAVPPVVLARPLWRMTWMKQCPRPLGGLPPLRRKER